MASIQKRPDGNYRARYRDEAGKEHARHFKRKVDAQRWLDEVTTAVVTGTYVDPQAGKVTFRRFYSDWSQRQIWVPSTRVNAERVVATVSFSDMPMKSIRRSHVESWIKSMTSTGLAGQHDQDAIQCAAGDLPRCGRRPGDRHRSECRSDTPPASQPGRLDDDPDRTAGRGHPACRAPGVPGVHSAVRLCRSALGRGGRRTGRRRRPP